MRVDNLLGKRFKLVYLSVDQPTSYNGSMIYATYEVHSPLLRRPEDFLRLLKSKYEGREEIHGSTSYEILSIFWSSCEHKSILVQIQTKQVSYK